MWLSQQLMVKVLTGLLMVFGVQQVSPVDIFIS